MDTPSKSLEERLVEAQTEIAALQAAQKSGFKTKLKKFLASIASALSTPEAIKAEKSLLVVALTRVVILVPTLAVLIDILIKALGGGGVNP